MAGLETGCTNPTTTNGKLLLEHEHHSGNHFYYKLFCDFPYTVAYKGQGKEFTCVEEDNYTRWIDHQDNPINKPTCVLDVISLSIGVGLGVVIPLIITIICLAYLYKKEKKRIRTSRPPQLSRRTSDDAMNEYYRNNRPNTSFPTYDDVDEYDNGTWTTDESVHHKESSNRPAYLQPGNLNTQGRRRDPNQPYGNPSMGRNNYANIGQYVPTALQAPESIELEELTNANPENNAYDNNLQRQSTDYRQMQAQQPGQQQQADKRGVEGNGAEIILQPSQLQNATQSNVVRRDSVSTWLVDL